jgi:hypothetical protein
MSTDFNIFGAAMMPTSPASVTITTAPTFGGIQSLTAQLNGSLLATWNPASSAITPLSYDVYIQAGTATGLFNTANRTDSTFGLSDYIFELASGALLVSGATYYVGIIARDPLGNQSTSTASISAVSVGVAPGRPLTPSDISSIVTAVWEEMASSHTNAGTFGRYLDAQVSTRSTQSSVNNIPTTPLLASDARLNTLDANISSRATQASVNSVAAILGTPAGSSMSSDIAAVKADTGDLESKLTSARASNLDNLDATISSRPSGADYTSARASSLNNLDATVSSRSTQASVNAAQASLSAIPTNPLLTSDSRINNLDATISSRATAASLASLASTVGTPAGASVSADIASVKSDSSGLRSDYTTARAGNLDDLDAAISSRATQSSVNAIPTNPALTTDSRFTNLDAAISSRATQSSVNAIPTNPALTTDSRLNNLDATVSSRATQTSVNAIPTAPQLASVALTQYNALVAALGSIQNNTNFSGIVPSYMEAQSGSGTEAYTFYASVFNSTGAPTNPDSSALNFTVKDNLGNTLQASTAMTLASTGKFTGVFTVTSSMPETDVVVFFDYALSGVAMEQVRTSRISATSIDSANIAAIKAKTDNLPSDPASNTQVNTRATQSSVNAIPTNPLLTTDSRLNDLDAPISSRATQASVSAIPTNPLLTTDSRLNDLDAPISSRAATADSRFGNLDAAVSSRATQSSMDTANAKIGTPTGASVSADIAAVKTDTGAISSKVDTTVSSRASASSLAALATTVGTPAGSSVSADIAAVQSTASAIETNTDVKTSTRAAQASVDAVPTATENADAVWSQDISKNATGTTTARTLKDAKIFSQTVL